MSSTKYSVVVFDLGNVLIPFDYDLVIKRFNAVSNGLGDKFVDYYRSNYEIHRGFERGDISEEKFIEKMLAVLENKIDKETFCKAYSTIFKVNENVAALLPVLKENYKLVLLSNTNSIHMEYGWKDYGFLKHFEKLILSHEVGAVKPEPEIYKAVERFTGEKPERHIFIDDIKEYAEGAKSMGWDAVQFMGYENLVKDLEERDIL